MRSEISIRLQSRPSLPLWVMAVEVAALTRHFVWRAVLIPWLFLWPSFVLLGNAVARGGDLPASIVREIQDPSGALIALWIALSGVHTATFLSSNSYLGFIKRYRDSQADMAGAALRRRRRILEWGRA